MEYSWQFDPLEPDKPVELTCGGVVIATTTLKSAQELAAKLNSYTDLYEALKGLLDWYDDLTLNNPDLESPIFWSPAIKALKKAGGK